MPHTSMLKVLLASFMYKKQTAPVCKVYGAAVQNCSKASRSQNAAHLIGGTHFILHSDGIVNKTEFSIVVCTIPDCKDGLDYALFCV